MEVVYWLLLCFCFSIVAGQKKSENCTSEDALTLRATRTNDTCAFIKGRIEVCSDGMWRTICDSNWTVQDAQVACRQLTYSSIGATAAVISNTAFDNVASFVPVCTGKEANISSCIRQNLSNTPGTCTKSAEIKCFFEDSSFDICFAGTTTSTSVSTNSPDPATTAEQGNSTQPSPTSKQNNDSTTVEEQGPTEFLTSLTGVVVIAVISSVTLLMIVVLLTVIIVVVCKRSPQNKREQQVSPKDLEDSLKEDSEVKPGHFVYNNSPGQNRRGDVNGADDPEHHYLEQGGPLYERVKDVQAPASVSSHDSGRSTTTSETNLQLNYSTLERNQDMPMPTYSTLERSQSEYAQVQPFINGSLTRGVTLQSPTSPDSDDHYHVLDRTTSQGSNFGSRRPSNSSSPKTRSKVNTSPKQNRGHHLPSITDDQEEIPDYAELESPVDSHRQVPTRRAVATQGASPELPPRHSPGQYRRHSNISKRPETHERVSPKIIKKSSTLPNTGRTSSNTANQRWSGSIDTTEHQNGLRTLMEGRLTSSNPNSSWV